MMDDPIVVVRTVIGRYTPRIQKEKAACMLDMYWEHPCCGCAVCVLQLAAELEEQLRQAREREQQASLRAAARVRPKAASCAKTTVLTASKETLPHVGVLCVLLAP